MTPGTLGRADLLAATDTLIWTADEPAIIGIMLVNRGTVGDALVRIAITSGGTPAATDYIEYDETLLPNKPLERTNRAINTGEKVYVRSSVAGVSARVDGIPAT